MTLMCSYSFNFVLVQTYPGYFMFHIWWPFLKKIENQFNHNKPFEKRLMMSITLLFTPWHLKWQDKIIRWWLLIFTFLALLTRKVKLSYCHHLLFGTIIIFEYFTIQTHLKVLFQVRVFVRIQTQRWSQSYTVFLIGWKKNWKKNFTKTTSLIETLVFRNFSWLSSNNGRHRTMYINML